MKKTHVAAVILAAGCGSRMLTDTTKQLMNIGGETVVLRSLKAFDQCNDIDSILLVARDEEIEFLRENVCPEIKKLTGIVCGGKTRAESARLGFYAICDEATHVAIHDAARCLITPQMISEVVNVAKEFGAATASSAVTDTVKKISFDGSVEATLPRGELALATTPQIFSTEIYKRAVDEYLVDESITDDNMLVERLGVKITAVDIGKENIKITSPSDIGLAEYILTKRGGKTMADYRIGHGYDVHKFVSDRPLVLGGVTIPYDYGLLGHSDADVLVHAIIDALLGAAALGDIGGHFPDSDDRYKGISSIELLRRVKELLSKENYIVSNIDATLVMQRPKIAGYVSLMVENIAGALDIEVSSVNVKATTEEGLGFTGCGQGASAHAVAMLIKK